MRCFAAALAFCCAAAAGAFGAPRLVAWRSSPAFLATPNAAAAANAASASPLSLSPSAAAPSPAAAAGGPWGPSFSSPRGPSLSCHAYPLTFGGGPRGGGEGEGRVALVTGASRGIGLSIAKTLAKGGVQTVICVARDQAGCDAAAGEIRELGSESEGFAVDVGDASAVSDLCSDLLRRFGRVDILVNNAGITRDKLFLKMETKDWLDVINVNLNSAFYFSHPILKQMAKNRFGRIINMSSVVGVGGNAGQANYSASKAGLLGLTKSLAKEYAGRNITVNAIAPGFIRSDMTDKMTPQAKEATIQRVPAGRLGTPQEVADLAAFLASDQSSYITGKVIPIDGGMLFGAN